MAAGFAARQRNAGRADDRSRRGDTRSAEYFVLGHDSRLAQVVTNLIDNACSFSEPGGTVRVSLARRDVAPDDEAPDERVVITVDDDGPGIPPHALERIFERFYTDRPSQGFGQNSGLGLSISRQIVEAHGGRIWASNRPADPGVRAAGERRCRKPPRHGAGARFVVELPAFAHERAGRPRDEDFTPPPSSIGESGVLILGPSGSGKSALALALLARAKTTGAFGALIGDDRVWLRAESRQADRVRRAAMAGLIERRAAGLSGGAQRAGRGREARGRSQRTRPHAGRAGRTKPRRLVA